MGAYLVVKVNWREGGMSRTHLTLNWSGSVTRKKSVVTQASETSIISQSVTPISSSTVQVSHPLVSNTCVSTCSEDTSMAKFNARVYGQRNGHQGRPFQTRTSHRIDLAFQLVVGGAELDIFEAVPVGYLWWSGGINWSVTG